MNLRISRSSPSSAIAPGGDLQRAACIAGSGRGPSTRAILAYRACRTISAPRLARSISVRRCCWPSRGLDAEMRQPLEVIVRRDVDSCSA